MVYSMIMNRPTNLPSLPQKDSYTYSDCKVEMAEASKNASIAHSATVKDLSDKLLFKPFSNAPSHHFLSLFQNITAMIT